MSDSSTSARNAAPARRAGATRDASHRSDEWFATTHWSVVLSAHGEDSAHARESLEKLCQTYWYPLYAYVRRLGRSPHDAEDIIQAFFGQALEKSYLAAADRDKGRFRSFLLVMLKRFMANDWNRNRALKRGRGQPTVSLDAISAERFYALEPQDPVSADKLFDRRWALTLLENVLVRLEAEQRQAGRGNAFEQLKEYLTSTGGGTPYSQTAHALGMSEAAVKVAVHRLKRRYRELLEEEIANVVSSPEEIAEERRHLLQALGY